MTLAAHLLVSAASELLRAEELLDFGGWRDELLLQTLRQARDRVTGVRLLVDARVQQALAMHRGEPVSDEVLRSIELGEAMLSP